MRRRIRDISIGVVAVLLIVGIIAVAWMLKPIAVDKSDADPAVIHANRVGKEGAPFREAYFEKDGRQLHYVTAGEGELVLFLHGFPSYWFSFIRQMEALKGDYQVLAIDGLGAGRSDAPRDQAAYKLETMAAHVLALLDHLDAEKVHLVGHDWGSTFAFGFAQRYPDRVASVTGLSAPPQNQLLEIMQNNPKLRETAAYIEQLKQANPLVIVALGGDKQVWKGAYQPLVAKGLLSAAEGELFRAATGKPKRINAHINWYRANIPAFDAITETSFWPSRGARLTMPAQIIWGEQDRVFVADYAEAVRNIADDVRLLPLADVGHWPHVEQPDRVTQAIRLLLAGEQARLAIDPSE